MGVAYANSNDYLAYNLKSSTIEIALAPGLNYFISKNLSLEATVGKIGFTRENINTVIPSHTNTYNFNFNLSDVKLGLMYKL